MPLSTQAIVSLSTFLFFSFLTFPFNGATEATQDNSRIIGAIINVNSRTGREEKISMEIAIQTFNNATGNKHKLVLLVRDSGGDPQQASRAGGLERIPLGWVMPSDAKPMVIGVPGRTSFEKFVKVHDGQEPTGFCIDVFKNAVQLLNYDLPYIFKPFDGLYDDLVDQVYFKNFDAVVGDVTILANRSNYVEFTQPYAESGLTMVVPVKLEKKAWLFVKPFTTTTWLVVSIVFAYTMFVAFPKGSPIARDFSKAFLKLSEDGTLNKLDSYWFKPSSQCSDNNMNNQSLSLGNFWGLFLVTGLTSTIVLILYIVRLFRKFRRLSVPPMDTESGQEDSVWIGIKKLGAFFDNSSTDKDPVQTQARDVEMDGECLSEYNTPEHPQATPVAETEIPETRAWGLVNQTRVLRLFNSFPGSDNRVHNIY
ncbi:Glutamate receptor 2.2 [Thalictrum thalictroides]|uniref:Glutamate receptor 2.2 n=1 Tax=Thalictrum thalictroides TaxID=46969 RepID=A0A7J6WWP6_THATH|nr:Glutamate receptor 2.2 [Thalictrum thalictroides]